MFITFICMVQRIAIFIACSKVVHSTISYMIIIKYGNINIFSAIHVTAEWCHQLNVLHRLLCLVIYKKSQWRTLVGHIYTQNYMLVPVCNPFLSFGLPKSFTKELINIITSAHKLLIEFGRYFRPSFPREQLICVQCNPVEDEEQLFSYFVLNI